MRLATLGLAPFANAKAPDGTYKFTQGSGKIQIGGQSLTLTNAQIKLLGSVKSGSVTIKKGNLVLDRNSGATILGKLSKPDLRFHPVIKSVSGPTSITFTKSGSAFIAKNSKPIVARFTAAESSSVAGVVKSNYDSKITGSQLIINVTFHGNIGIKDSVDQPKIDGSAKIIFTR